MTDVLSWVVVVAVVLAPIIGGLAIYRFLSSPYMRPTIDSVMEPIVGVSDLSLSRMPIRSAVERYGTKIITEDRARRVWGNEAIDDYMNQYV